MICSESLNFDVCLFSKNARAALFDVNEVHDGQYLIDTDELLCHFLAAGPLMIFRVSTAVAVKASL